MRRALGLALAASVGFAAPCAAATSEVSATGFVVTHRLDTAATPRQVHEALVQVGRWWSSAHTWSGRAANLSLEPRASGCFCERWDDQSVEHARVVYLAPGRVLRLVGGLGPLQALPVTAVLTWSTAVKDGRTELMVTYRVAGDATARLDTLAGPVDRVLGEQVQRLQRYVDTGSPD